MTLREVASGDEDEKTFTRRDIDSRSIRYEW